MKEAAGEANMTVITIVLIGVVAAVGLLLVPRLMGNLKARSCCTDAGWCISGNRCCDPNATAAQCNSGGNYGAAISWIRDVAPKTTTSIFYSCMGGV